jgi:hypothetical protein
MLKFRLLHCGEQGDAPPGIAGAHAGKAEGGLHFVAFVYHNQKYPAMSGVGRDRGGLLSTEGEAAVEHGNASPESLGAFGAGLISPSLVFVGKVWSCWRVKPNKTGKSLTALENFTAKKCRIRGNVTPARVCRGLGCGAEKMFRISEIAYLRCFFKQFSQKYKKYAVVGCARARILDVAME